MSHIIMPVIVGKGVVVAQGAPDVPTGMVRRAGGVPSYTPHSFPNLRSGSLSVWSAHYYNKIFVTDTVSNASHPWEKLPRYDSCL